MNTPVEVTADRMINLHGFSSALVWAERHALTMITVEDQHEYWKKVHAEIHQKMTEPRKRVEVR